MAWDLSSVPQAECTKKGECTQDRVKKGSLNVSPATTRRSWTIKREGVRQQRLFAGVGRLGTQPFKQWTEQGIVEHFFPSKNKTTDTSHCTSFLLRWTKIEAHAQPWNGIHVNVRWCFHQDHKMEEKNKGLLHWRSKHVTSHSQMKEWETTLKLKQSAFC